MQSGFVKSGMLNYIFIHEIEKILLAIKLQKWTYL